MFSIETAIPSFGVGATTTLEFLILAVFQILKLIIVVVGIDLNFLLKLILGGTTGSGGAATALINGVKNLQLIDGGIGYSSTNPPTVKVTNPTSIGSVPAKITATVTDGSITGLTLDSSGSGYRNVPRITFVQPGGAEIDAIPISNGSISGTIEVVNNGQGYTTAPEIYIDEPTGDNPIKASLRTVLNSDGEVESITVLNADRDILVFLEPKIIQPVGAQVLKLRLTVMVVLLM